MIIRRPAAAAIFAPVAYEPVKKMPSIGWRISAAPVAPSPTTGTNTSRGMPASCSISAMCRPVRVANSDGLYSTALPATSAGTKTLLPTKYG